LELERRAKGSYEVLSDCPYEAPRTLYVITTYGPEGDAEVFYMRTRKPNRYK
jgi:hypothetical protein